MKCSQAIEKLAFLISVFGDLPIVGGNIMDDTPPTEFIAITEEGCEPTKTDYTVIGVFIK